MTISSSPDIAQNARDYARIEAAILYLEEHFRDQPRLDEMSRQAGLDPHHFQRLFRRWAGISPKRFGQFLTLDYARAQLEASASILDAAYDAGLSGPSRLHDLFVTYEAMSPGAFKRGGAGVDIAWGVHPSPFGPCFVGQTERGICALGFADGDADSDIQAVRAEFERRWPAARFHEDRARHRPGCGPHLPGGRRAASSRGRRAATRCGSPSAAPISSSRCGRRCCAYPPAGSPPTRRSPGRSGCRAAPARSAAPSPPTRSPGSSPATG